MYTYKHQSVSKGKGLEEYKHVAGVGKNMILPRRGTTLNQILVISERYQNIARLQTLEDKFSILLAYGGYPVHFLKDKA